MKMRVFLAVAACVAAAGCSTLESRIAGNQGAFNTYPPDAQRKIQAGEIARGFTKPMVEIAWGRPDDVSRKEDAEGASETWEYRGYRHRFVTTYAMGSPVCVGRHGHRYGYIPYAYVPHEMSWDEDYTRASVTFRGGRVIAFSERGGSR